MAGTPNIAELERQIPPEELTPAARMLLEVVRQLQTEIQQLRDEIDRLKGLPEKPKRQPSSLNDPTGPPSSTSGNKKPRRKNSGTRPGSAKRSKTKQLEIHQTVPLYLDGLPEGTEFIDYKDFTVQDLHIGVFNTLFRRARYKLPDGTYRTAPLPPEISSHFGNVLEQYALYQHFHNHVTQPLLLEELREFGVDISAGTVNRMLTEGHSAFHQEKDSLLGAAREVSSYLQTDDTSARHQGRSGHTLHIGNDFFATFFTTETKSRVNFLKCLLTPFTDYVLNLDALFYLESADVPQWLLKTLRRKAKAWTVYDDETAWERQLKRWKIKSSEHRRLVTEAALWANMLARDMEVNTVLISDDALQFKLLGFSHGLCWLHQERHLTGLIPLTDEQRAAQSRVRDAVWKYYQRLKRYRASPTPQSRGRLEKDFERLFLQATGWEELDQALRKIHSRKQNLLLVLEHPEIPLHNNLSEHDIRQYVKKRKISAGTRSDTGRRSRDTFLSLKTTCRKLGVSFWSYLRDRLMGLGEIPALGELIKRKAAEAVA